ncbi:hypothetical protein GCM10009764_60100 [Nocardia ninae]|uniref:Ricin B lectin domain-containing protein n=2 Tax=Nocardia ninae TaxID=356145 RepID=A0A511MLI2_9NOCA|nr:hypothetical protein NN4_55160 [Nocardia ninae NBRC 108245]
MAVASTAAMAAPAQASDGVSRPPESLGSGLYFVNHATGKCLEVSNNDGRNGARVQQWKCEDQDSAYWTSHYDDSTGENLYFFTPVSHPTKCLEIADYSKQNGAKAQLWDCVGQANAYWRWKDDRIDGVYRSFFVNLHSGKCLEIADANQSNGAVAQQWDCVGQRNAFWDDKYQP